MIQTSVMLIAYRIGKSVVSFLAHGSYCGGIYIWVAFHHLEKTPDALDFGIGVLRGRHQPSPHSVVNNLGR